MRTVPLVSVAEVSTPPTNTATLTTLTIISVIHNMKIFKQNFREKINKIDALI
jgi:hypothetical protein